MWLAPTACRYVPAYGSSSVNKMRSARRPFWMPAARKFASTDSSKFAPTPSLDSMAAVLWLIVSDPAAAGSPANASARCGDRLSTVNGPETRTIAGSQYGLS